MWAYYLMPNHVHLVVVPESEDGLRHAIGEAHRRYTRRVNLREDWRGHLWQGRFAWVVLVEAHVLAAVRYVERNAVRAGLVATAEKWPWSSARAHVSGRDDTLAQVVPMLERVGGWAEYLAALEDEPLLEALRRRVRTGRVLGGESFVETIEAAPAPSSSLQRLIMEHHQLAGPQREAGIRTPLIIAEFDLQNVRCQEFYYRANLPSS